MGGLTPGPPALAEEGAVGGGSVVLLAPAGPLGLPGAGGAALPLDLGTVALPLTAGDLASAGGGAALGAVAARRLPVEAGEGSSEALLPSAGPLSGAGARGGPPGAEAGALGPAGGGAPGRGAAPGPRPIIGAESIHRDTS